MPEYRGLGIRSAKRQIFGMSLLVIATIPTTASPKVAYLPFDSGTGLLGGNVTSGMQADHYAAPTPMELAMAAQPVPAAGDDTVHWTRTRILEEIGKQAIEQPGHFLVGAAPIWAARSLLGAPGLGWAAAPVIAYREWLQWPSNRWWDPPLDWAFFTLGAVAATRNWRPLRRLMAGLAALRQGLVWRFAVRSRMRPAT